MTLRTRVPVPKSRAATVAIAPDLVSRIGGLRSRLKTEIGKVVFLLDLAALHAQEIAKKIGDPDARKIFNKPTASIERSLQVALDRAREL
jgi:hypothetical protein